MLETERLILRLMEEQDEHDIVKWRNKQDIMDNLFSDKGITISQHRSWYVNYLKDNKRLEFVISIKENNEKIGTIGLSNIDYKNQKAEYGILIGETQERGKGYAEEASIAIINYAFSELNLLKIKLEVFTDNLSAIKLYKRLGFKEEGIFKKEFYKNSSFKDVMTMAVLKDEWTVSK